MLFYWYTLKELIQKAGAWRRCPAVAVEWSERYHCDLRVNHAGEHLTDRGMYDVGWTDRTHTVSK